MLFYFHTHGRPHLDVILHLFVSITDAAIAGSILLEMAFPH
ncbi:unnamed protein product, partial [Allacma fusca]